MTDLLWPYTPWPTDLPGGLSQDRLWAYLPLVFRASRLFRALADAQGPEADRLREGVYDVVLQGHPGTATWSLPWWEWLVGLSPAPDQPAQQRREKVIARWRGSGTATLSQVYNVAQAFTYGTVEVVEDHERYTVQITWADEIGRPAAQAEAEAAIRAVIPAHLLVTFRFRFGTWEGMHQTGATWEQIHQTGLTWDALRSWPPAVNGSPYP